MVSTLFDVKVELKLLNQVHSIAVTSFVRSYYAKTSCPIESRGIPLQCLL
jgi:hypothetical protein